MVQNVIDTAKKYVGYLEKKSNSQLEDFTANAGSANYTIFAQMYNEWWGTNWQAQPWCAVWVSCVFREAIGEDLFPAFAYCPTGVNWFKNNGKWFTSNPQKGDVIFFKNTSGIAGHVGIVIDTDDTYVWTIEGNTSSAAGVVANGGAVAQKAYTLDYNRILGYGRPDIPVKEVEEEMTQEQFNTMMNNYLEQLGQQEPDAWSMEARVYVEGAGIINGDQYGNKKYKKPVTREELAQILYRVLNK